jgi:hypothetical protein
VKDTQNARPTDSHVGSRNQFRGTDSSSNGNRGEFPSGAGERRPTRVRGRLVLAIAVALFAFITPAAPMIAASGTTQLVATGMYSDGNQSRISGDNISWSSSDPTVATVTSPGGLVTGVSIGTATITASTTSAIPSSGCSVELSGGGITKTCRGGSSETITATATVNVTEGSE